jgi:hypothetical protein
MAQWNEVTRTENGQEIPGKRLRAFVHSGDTYFPTDVEIYKDGIIGCLGLVEFEQFKEYIAQGKVITSLPENAEVRIGFLARFRAKYVRSWIKEKEFLKEIIDIIDELNGRLTSSQKCREAYERFQEDPCEATRIALKIAYESIPEHNRKYVGDMDSKDIPLRKIIYREENGE